MADNYLLPGHGTTIATDDVNGVNFYKMKLSTGAAGVDGGLVSNANPLPVSFTSVPGSITAIGGAGADHAPQYGPPDTTANIAAQVDPAGQLMTRGLVLTDEGGYRCNFANASLAVSIGTCTFTNGSAIVTGTGFSNVDIHVGNYVYLDADGVDYMAQVAWLSDTELELASAYTGTGGTGAASRQIIKSVVGAGGTIAVSSGQATINAQTTATSVFELERDVDYLPLVKESKFSISQRIANQDIYCGFYDESAASPKWYTWFHFTGTTNTVVNCVCAWNPTTAPSGGEIVTQTVTLPAGVTTAVSNTYRVELLKDRVLFYCNEVLMYTERRVVPHPHALQASTIRVVNGTTPATNTAVVIDYDACSNFDVVSTESPSKSMEITNPNVPAAEVLAYSRAGVIAINTVLGTFDASQYRAFVMQTISMGTSGVVTVQHSQDNGTTWNTVHIKPIGGGAAVTTHNAAGSWYVPAHGGLTRLLLSAATTAGTTTIRVKGLHQIPLTWIDTVAITATNLSCNVAQWGGQSPINPTANGSANRVIVAAMATAISNTDQNATAFAGSGRVNGTIVAASNGGGSVITAEINISALTLGSATHIVPILQESNGGTNFTDIWTGDPVTTTGIIRVPAIPVAGRRRWCMHSIGGTSTTVTVTITTLELPSGYVCQRQYRDKYSATNPLATVINNVTQTATTLVDTGASCMTATTQFTPGFIVEGTKVVTMFAVLGNGPTVTTQPVLTLQFSNDLTNWWSSTATITGAGNGTYAASAANQCFRYARIAVTTAAAYSAGNYTIASIGANGVN